MLLAVNLAHAGTDDFHTGLEYGKDGLYPEAARAFAHSAKTEPASGTFLNLGLVEWQRGHAGAAILAWEQAQWLDPFDARIENNLKFARQIAQVDAPELQWYETASTWLPPYAWLWLAGVSLWVTVALLVLPGVCRRRVRSWQQALAAVAFGIFLFSLTANAGVVSRTNIGFVVKRNASLRLTPTRDSEVTATLTAGEPARQLRSRGNYVFVRTLNGSGWVGRDEFQLVCP
ncbi:MAG TPA: tetratricopeptide repeat protein [Verrucomicrobiae bacterium]